MKRKFTSRRHFRPPPPVPQPYQWDFAPVPARPLAPRSHFATSAELLRVPARVPQVLVSPLALFKMHAIVSAIDIEVGWLGTAHRKGANFVIDDVYLFQQTASSGHTEIKPEALQEFALDILAKPKGDEVFNSVRFWGHSHGSGATFPSGQDDAQMEVFQTFGGDFFLRGILNRVGDMNLSVYDWTRGVAFHTVPWRVVPGDLPDEPDCASLEEELRAEMKRKVTGLRYPPPMPGIRTGSVTVAPYRPLDSKGLGFGGALRQLFFGGPTPPPQQ